LQWASQQSRPHDDPDLTEEELMSGSAEPRWCRLKYAVDPCLAVILLGLLAPLFALVALLIKLDDGGSVFFRQERAGLHGREFRIWKFRTMIPNAHELSGGYFPKDIQLITRVGRLLRKTSIDEIPQLLNILAGHMCFIGPRPTLPEQVVRYTLEQRRRLQVKPGITGWAQLHGRNTLPWSKRIAYDLEYIERHGARLDLEILLRTIPAVLLGTGMRMDQTSEDNIDDLAPAVANARTKETT
jgi:lipopolysaccharide/colanic/teichoic acid biosynthesis glycosyltransferase